MALDEALTRSTRQPLGGRKTFPFITASMVGVGIGAYAVAANLSVYLVEQYNVPAVDSTVIVSAVNGATNIAPIIGGVMSDSCLSSFAVITVACTAFSLGMLLFTFTASFPSLRPPPCSSPPCQPPAKWQLAVLYTAITLTIFGVGGTRFTTATMGSAQSDDAEDQAAFFRWYVTGSYISTAIGIVGIIYVQDNVGWIAGFGLSTSISVLGLAIFLLCSHRYLNSDPNNKVFDICHSYCKEDDDDADDLRKILRLAPLIATGVILNLYLGIQMSICFLQALVTDRRLGPHFSIPVGSIYVFMTIGTMVSIPVLDHVIYPACRFLIGEPPAPLPRIAIGFSITVLAMVYGAVAESKRLDALRSSSEPFSVLWIVPCLMLMGLGEALHFPGQLAFFFQEFPASLKGSGAAVNALQTGIASFLTSAVIELLRKWTGWIDDDANSSRLDNVYWMLAATGVLNLGCFLMCARVYQKTRGGGKFEF